MDLHPDIGDCCLFAHQILSGERVLGDHLRVPLANFPPLPSRAPTVPSYHAAPIQYPSIEPSSPSLPPPLTTQSAPIKDFVHRSAAGPPPAAPARVSIVTATPTTCAFHIRRVCLDRGRHIAATTVSPDSWQSHASSAARHRAVSLTSVPSASSVCGRRRRRAGFRTAPRFLRRRMDRISLQQRGRTTAAF